MAATAEPVTIRPARAGDIAAMTRLLGLLFAIEADFRVEPERQRRGLELLLDHPFGHIAVAVSGGAVVGMCSGQLTVSTAEGGYALVIEDLVVEAAFRGRHLGQRLVEAVAGWAAGFGATRIQLLADRDNHAALAFYRHLGWRGTNLICLRGYHLSGEDRLSPLPRS